MEAQINPKLFGPRGQAYLKALENSSQVHTLQACSSHEDYRSVLDPLRSAADKYFAPQDTFQRSKD